MNTRIKILLTLCIFSSFTTSYASNDETNRNYSASMSTNGNMILRKGLSIDTSLAAMFDIYHRKNKDDDVRQNNNGTTETSSEYSYSRVEFQLGIKRYFNQGKYQTFMQPLLGGIILRETRKYYSDNVERNDEQAITMGAVLSLGFGVEYNITKNLSLEGIYTIRIDHIDLDFKEDSKRKETNIQDFGALYATYYW